jgi:hypothetical protein
MLSLNIFENSSAAECRYCGNAHAVTELCRAQRVNRRMFLFTASAAAVGALLPAPPVAIEASMAQWGATWTVVEAPNTQLFLATLNFRKVAEQHGFEMPLGAWTEIKAIDE